MSWDNRIITPHKISPEDRRCFSHHLERTTYLWVVTNNSSFSQDNKIIHYYIRKDQDKKLNKGNVIEIILKQTSVVCYMCLINSNSTLFCFILYFDRSGLTSVPAVPHVGLIFFCPVINFKNKIWDFTDCSRSQFTDPTHAEEQKQKRNPPDKR